MVFVGDMAISDRAKLPFLKIGLRHTNEYNENDSLHTHPAVKGPPLLHYERHAVSWRHLPYCRPRRYQ